MTGEYISDARASFDHNNQSYVALSFTPSGARQFERVTGENVKKRLAIVLDGKVYSAPTIQEKISGGRASITGRFSTEEARDLAIVLRAGALPAPVTILEQRSVGPSLGQESIEKGIHSALIGGIAVVAFMTVGLRRLDYDRLMTVALLASAFFVASLIHGHGPGPVHRQFAGSGYDVDIHRAISLMCV